MSTDLIYEPSLLAQQADLERGIFQLSYDALATISRSITSSTSLPPTEKMMMLRLLPDNHPAVLDARAVCGYYCKEERPSLFGIGVESLRQLLDDRAYRGYVHAHRDRLRSNAEHYGTPWLCVADTPQILYSAIDEINTQLDDPSLSYHARRDLEMRRGILAPRDTLRSRYTAYPAELVEKLVRQRSSHQQPRLAFSITTCKRLATFKESMNAFLNCCLDLDMIDIWFLVDDNSSEEDRAEMKRMYPFFQFIERGPTARGHAKGLNMLWDILEERGIEHVFHMEDDRVFLRPKEYIHMGMSILDDGKEEGIAQFAYSRGYANSWNEWHRRDGHTISRLNPRLHYVIHHGPQNERDMQWECFRVETWPHFTLNPSLLHLGRLRRSPELDTHFLEQHDTFEFEFAVRYTRAGFKTAFPDDVFVLHIGKLHWEQHTLKQDAYQLNRHDRFGRKY